MTDRRRNPGADRGITLTKAGLIALIIAQQGGPCGHIVCGGRDHCLLAEVKP